MSALPKPPATPPTHAAHAAPLTPLQPLPRLSRTEAQARTTIAQRGAHLPVPLGAATWRAQLVPVVHATPFLEPSYVIRMEWAGAAFALRLPASAVDQQVSASLNGASLPALPASLVDATVEAAMSALLDALQGLGRGTPALLSCRAATQDTAALPAHALELTLRAEPGHETIAAALHTDGLGLLLIAGLLASKPITAAQHDLDIPLQLHAELGMTRLAAHEVSQLASGDVVLMDAFFVAPHRVLWLSADGLHGVHAQLPASDNDAPPSSAHLTIIQPWTAHMPTDIDTETSPAAAATSGEAGDASSLHTLPVRLSFDLGDVTLTLAQIQALQVGQTLDLGRPLHGAVRLRANGALIGEGDLVDIDGHIGVSVSRIFGPSR